MPFHTRDEKTDDLVRELTRRRNCGLTEAVKQAGGGRYRMPSALLPAAPEWRNHDATVT
jgi:hypothetical protein